MIRVLQVVTHMNRGGLETMLMNYYRHIDRSQVQFDFLTHRSTQADYDAEIKALGGVIYHLPRLNPFSIGYRKALSDFFRTHPEYKIVHVQQDCMSSVILKAAAKSGVSVRIGHSHNSNQDKNLKYPIKLFYRHFISKYATQLFACSVDAGKWMFCGAPFEVLPNAIEAKDYRFSAQKRQEMRRQLGVAGDELLVGHVGRFSPPKNHDFLIDIFAEIHKKNTAKLLLIGDGGLREGIAQKAAKLGVEQGIIFTGVRGDVADLMQAMDVFVFPSLYEGLPLVIVEAQAAGLPCLISDRVPIECKITDLVWQVPLASEVGEWAQRAVAVASMERCDTFEQIRVSGYDIGENAEKLQEFYLKAAEGK